MTKFKWDWLVLKNFNLVFLFIYFTVFTWIIALLLLINCQVYVFRRQILKLSAPSKWITVIISYLRLWFLQDLEKELEVQIGLKQELEVGMRLLERDIHEKQDFITSLRTQLDDVKALNIQLTQKAEVCFEFVNSYLFFQTD